MAHSLHSHCAQPTHSDFQVKGYHVALHKAIDYIFFVAFVVTTKHGNEQCSTTQAPLRPGYSLQAGPCQSCAFQCTSVSLGADSAYQALQPGPRVPGPYLLTVVAWPHNPPSPYLLRHSPPRLASQPVPGRPCNIHQCVTPIRMDAPRKGRGHCLPGPATGWKAYAKPDIAQPR